MKYPCLIINQFWAQWHLVDGRYTETVLDIFTHGAAKYIVLENHIFESRAIFSKGQWVNTPIVSVLKIDVKDR